MNLCALKQNRPLAEFKLNHYLNLRSSYRPRRCAVLYAPRFSMETVVMSLIELTPILSGLDRADKLRVINMCDPERFDHLTY